MQFKNRKKWHAINVLIIIWAVFIGGWGLSSSTPAQAAVTSWHYPTPSTFRPLCLVRVSGTSQQRRPPTWVPNPPHYLNDGSVDGLVSFGGEFTGCDLVGNQNYVPPRLYAYVFNTSNGQVSGQYSTSTLPGVNHDSVNAGTTCYPLGSRLLVDVYLRAWNLVAGSYSGAQTNAITLHLLCGGGTW